MAEDAASQVKSWDRLRAWVSLRLQSRLLTCVGAGHSMHSRVLLCTCFSLCFFFSWLTLAPSCSTITSHIQGSLTNKRPELKKENRKGGGHNIAAIPRELFWNLNLVVRSCKVLGANERCCIFPLILARRADKEQGEPR